MTSKLKCPFCGEELGGNMAEPCCRNQNCEMYAIPIPRTIWEKLIQSQKDLEESQQATLQNAQTVLEIHKDLEIAVDALNTIIATPLNSRVIHDTANKALKQIDHIAGVSKMVEYKE